MPRFTIDDRDFGALPDGTRVKLYTLLDQETVTEIGVTPYGATLQGVKIPDRDGNPGDVVLGHPDVSGYVNGTSYQGGTIGRWHNRIGGGRIEIDGEVYELGKNEGPDGGEPITTLHGGVVGFNKKLWSVVIAEAMDACAVIKMRLVSPDGEEGFPGKVEADTGYVLYPGRMRIPSTAITDRRTVYGTTNHAYWNLGNIRGATINGHQLRACADVYLDVDGNLVPNGRMLDVEGSDLDFREGKEFGTFEYDHCLVFANDGGWHRAELSCPETGRVLVVETSETGLQVYSGNFLGSKDADGTPVGPDDEGFVYRQACCLEDQRLPNAMRILGFGPYLLDPGLPYQKATNFLFGTR